jgi:hypothetical protein
MTIFSTTKLFLMLRRVQHILLSDKVCALDNQINVSESSTPLSQHRAEIHIYICVEN